MKVSTMEKNNSVKNAANNAAAAVSFAAQKQAFKSKMEYEEKRQEMTDMKKVFNAISGSSLTKEEAKPETEGSTKVVLQVQGNPDLSMDSLVERVKAAYVAEGHTADSIKNVEVYIKLSENMVYYVIDGYASGIRLF